MDLEKFHFMPFSVLLASVKLLFITKNKTKNHKKNPADCKHLYSVTHPVFLRSTLELSLWWMVWVWGYRAAHLTPVTSGNLLGTLVTCIPRSCREGKEPGRVSRG